MIGKSQINTNITSDVSRLFNEKNELIEKQKELKEKIEELTLDLDEIRRYFNTCVNVDDLTGLVNDIKSSFELFVVQTPRQNDDEIVKRLAALEARVSEIPDMRLIPCQQNVSVEPSPVSCKKEIPKLNISKRKNN